MSEILIPPNLSEKAKTYLYYLCLEIPSRAVGSPGNQAAVAFFAEKLASFGYQIECPVFDCMDWSSGGAQLVVGEERYPVQPSPYSPGCRVQAPLEIASTVQELADSEAANKVLLLYGEIAKEQLMPKNFPFYNPDEHKQIIHLLETKNPVAIIAATSRNPEMAGAVYPFPLIEDGDFNIPSVFMTEEDGLNLARHAGEPVSLDIQAERIPSRGSNVIARKGDSADRRVVVCAHIDSKAGTPGALDNASGVVVLLLLAELLKEYKGRIRIEIVAINGEDYYSSPGEVLYLNQNLGKFGEILLNVNLDGVGYYQGASAYSLYGCPDDLASVIRKAFSSQDQLVEGDQWYQGDHIVFVMNQVPALAITSERAVELLTSIVHTPHDLPENLDPARLVGIALALEDLLTLLADEGNELTHRTMIDVPDPPGLADTI